MPHVAELSYPGKWLDHDDHEWSLRVERHFHHLERFLAEAAISLGLFEAAMREREGRAWRGDRRGGGLPEPYEHLVPYVHARAFLGAMDDVGRWLAALGEASRPDSPGGARRRISVAFPRMLVPGGGGTGLLGCGLLQVEEMQPARDGSPHGGMLVLEEREGRWYALRSTGECRREVEVGAETLFAARDCVQAAIRALPWRGPCRRFP